MNRKIMRLKILNTIHIGLLFLSGTILLTGVEASESETRGPFRIRNQFPATLPFLSFAADDAYFSRQGQWQVAISYSHANTFTRSAGILSQFSGEAERIAFNPDYVNSDNKANRLYYIDSGTGRMSLQLKYSPLNHLSLSLEIPIIKYYGGFLDVPIETFHKLVGYPYDSRAMMSANDTHFYMSLNDDFYLSADQLSTSGIGDSVFIVKKHLLSKGFYRPAFAVRFATKLPTGDVGTLKGSGSIDFGLDMILSKKIGRGFATTNFAVVIPGKWQLLPEIDTRPSYSWILVYEHPVGNLLSLIIQNQILTSVLSSDIHPDISRTSYEWTVGAKFDLLKSIRISAGVTENYINHENAPDFGFHAGLEWRL